MCHPTLSKSGRICVEKVLPPNIDRFLLYGNPIETVYAPECILDL